MAIRLRQRVPENAAGDFYVEADTCMRCCLPHEQAPELMNDCKVEFRECYFRRQPQTPQEVENAIQAISMNLDAKTAAIRLWWASLPFIAWFVAPLVALLRQLRSLDGGGCSPGRDKPFPRAACRGGSTGFAPSRLRGAIPLTAKHTSADVSRIHCGIRRCRNSRSCRC